jgi:hypothetical protein
MKAAPGCVRMAASQARLPPTRSGLWKGSQSLTNPLEWAANPDTNVARPKSGVQTLEMLGKIANLGQPTSRVTNPNGNAQLGGAVA